jgi:hypothetical protein
MAAKKTTPRISADRAEGLKKTQVRAGKSKGTVADRAKQNAGVKDGTIKLGAGGKSYNIWDAKTQTWKRGQVVAPKAAAPKATGPIQFGGTKKPTPKTVGPSVVGIKNPSDGREYRFGGPGNMEVFRWDAKTKKFVFVRKHTPAKSK